MFFTHVRRRWGALFLLLGVAGILLFAGGLEREQDLLSERVIRLHVIANSDGADDQNLKLLVRDRIMEELSPYLSHETDIRSAEQRITSSLPALCTAGEEEVRKNGYQYPVTAALEQSWFPTREYGGFALPAGEYTALRVVIGEGEGENWWCVVFPPLCMGVVSEPAEIASAAGFSDKEASLITGETEGYVFRLKSIELWEEWKAKLQR